MSQHRIFVPRKARAMEETWNGDGAMIVRSRKRGTRAVATYPITELISYTGPIRGRRVNDK